MRCGVRLFIISNVDRESYFKMLEHLERECDTFSLVDINFHPDNVHPTKEALTEHLKNEMRVSSWPGTTRIFAKEEDRAIATFYTCNVKSVSILYKFDSFYQIENDMDISFFKNEVCVVLAINHERIMIVDLDFWGTFFDEMDCQLCEIDNHDFKFVP
jgi:hypothetical protein